MTITERTLKKWRREALETEEFISGIDHDKVRINLLEPTVKEFSRRILRLTLELLDQHLLRKEVR